MVKTAAIVLSALKYGEADLIVKAYTLSDGLRSYMLRGVLKSRKGKFRASMFQPLTQLEISAKHKNQGKLEYLSDARVSSTYQSLHLNPVKTSVGLFLAEMLRNSIQEEEQNEPLFDYLKNSLDYLDTTDKFANFHLLFLLNLTRFLGFFPHAENENANFFNMLEGVFQTGKTSDYCVEGKYVDVLKIFMHTGFDQIHEVKLSQDSRSDFLDLLLDYYRLHIEGFRKPKSLAVLTEIFR